MASSAPTVSIDDPRTTLGGAGILPPARDGGDDRPDDGSRDFDARLRRARLGMGVAVAGIVMIFVSFTSAYIVRQGLPTLDPRTGTLVRDWIPVRLPALLLVNTCVLLLSSWTMALARRQVAGEAALADGGGSIPGVSAGSEQKISWLALTVVLGASFLGLQWMAWCELGASGFYVATSPSSSFVYLLTGMHGVHLIGGVVALLIAGGASLLHRPATSRLVIVDVTGWYWHFMAILWVYILCLLEFAR
jgi:cytochrome c oxidase subunit III